MSDVKKRISILWISLTVIVLLRFVAYLYEPGSIEKLIAGEGVLSPGLAIFEAFMDGLIPLSMAVLSISLRSRVNRILNLILGVFFTCLGIGYMINCPILHITDNPAIYQLLLIIAQIAIPILIIGHAWKLRD